MPPTQQSLITSPLSLFSFEAFAKKLAPLFAERDTVLLTGDLGAGKTTFVQYVAQKLGIGEDQYVSSPSFALLHEYTGNVPVFHMDLYRLADEDDFEAAGLLEYLGFGLCFIEWPDRLGSFTPDNRLEIEILICDEEKRRLKFTPLGSKWHCRISELQKIIHEL